MNFRLSTPILLLALTGCSLAPTYHRPNVTPAVTPALHQGVAAENLGWQDYFSDARLHALIQAALENNQDLRIAVANVQAVRAQYAISRAARLPTVAADLRQNASGSLNDRLKNTGAITRQYSAGLGITAFEIDLFGRMKSLSDAAVARFFTAQSNRDAAQITLIAAVAKAYFAQQTALKIRALAEKNLNSRNQLLSLAKLRLEHGTFSDLDFQAAQMQAANAQKSLAAAKESVSRADNALALLVGSRLPENLPPAGQTWFTPLQGNITSEHLLERPDIRAAEYTLRAANADIGAARAAFFPSISLTAVAGSASGALNTLFDHNGQWQFSPAISLPIFTWGRNIANLNAAKAKQQAAVAQYEKAVQAAFRDAADALNAKDSLNKQLNSQETATQSAERSRALTRLKYEHGAASLSQALQADIDTTDAQIALLRLRLMQAENLADLYKALGGGLKRTGNKIKNLPSEE